MTLKAPICIRASSYSYWLHGFKIGCCKSQGFTVSGVYIVSYSDFDHGQISLLKIILRPCEALKP